MRVAIIISRIAHLGPVMVIKTLVDMLSENGKLTIRVFYLDKKIDPQIKMKVPVEMLYPGKFPFEDFDIIHTNGIRPDLFAFMKRRKIKYHISTIHNFVFEDLSFTYNKLISIIFGYIWLIFWRRADKLVCISEIMKTYYEKWFSSSKLKVIYNGISQTDNFLAPDNDVILVIDGFRLKGLKVIGVAGILTKIKGIDQVLYLLEKEREIALIIIGAGKELVKLKGLAEKLDVIDRCHFCGFRSSAVNYFKHFDLFLIPSRSEGFGLALIEAVQQKVPVICSDLVVFKELFCKDEVTFFKLEDINSLANALKEVSETGSKKIALAYSRYQNNYTDRIMANRYLDLYKTT